MVTAMSDRERAGEIVSSWTRQHEMDIQDDLAQRIADALADQRRRDAEMVREWAERYPVQNWQELADKIERDDA